MSKNKHKAPQKQQSTQLNPKNYIIEAGRKLPIYKCFINADWKEENMASVWVSRIRPNGQLVIGFYLIDPLCLGLKDSFYIFGEMLTT